MRSSLELFPPNLELHSVRSFGACLIRPEGNDEALKEVAKRNALKIGAGHTFNIVLKDAFPINILNAVKMCQFCNLFCATANPVEVILARSGQQKEPLASSMVLPPKE